MRGGFGGSNKLEKMHLSWSSTITIELSISLYKNKLEYYYFNSEHSYCCFNK